MVDEQNSDVRRYGRCVPQLATLASFQLTSACSIAFNVTVGVTYNKYYMWQHVVRFVI